MRTLSTLDELLITYRLSDEAYGIVSDLPRDLRPVQHADNRWTITLGDEGEGQWRLTFTRTNPDAMSVRAYRLTRRHPRSRSFVWKSYRLSDLTTRDLVAP